MTLTRLLILTALTVAFQAVAMGQAKPQAPANMTGTWKLNIDKSDFGGGPRPGSDKLSVFTVAHSEPEISFTVTGWGTDESPLNMSFSGGFDGKFRSMEWNGLSAELKLWRIDRSTTKGVMRASMGGNTMELETHTIVVAEDGRSFKRTGITAGGMKQTLFYEKQD